MKRFDHMTLRKAMCLYAVTDRSWLDGRSLSEVCAAAIAGGITFLQIREKQLGRAAFLAEARTLKRLAADANIPFVVNDAVDIAKEIDADGAHIGQSDESLATARALLGEDKIIGISVQNVAEARAAARGGADYLGVGAVFATATKTDAKLVDRQALQDICRSVDIPVVAIGGISADRVLSLAGSGVDGIAVVSALFAAGDIEDAARELRALSERMVSSR